MITDHRGRVAVVTGAASGIGRSLIRRFHDQGASVVAADVDKAGLDETLDPLDPARTQAVVVDVSRAEQVDQLAATAYERFSRTDVLVNNAGVFQGGLAWEVTAGEWDWVTGVNLTGVVNGVRAFVPRMIEQSEPAHVVNTASMAAHLTTPLSGPYAATKAAVQAFTESLAHDLAIAGTQVVAHCLVPSLIRTGIGTSERSRPDTTATHRSELKDFVEQALRDSTAGGLDPDVVAGMVLDAIATDQFLIPTKDSYRDQIRERSQALLECRLPPTSTVD